MVRSCIFALLALLALHAAASVAAEDRQPLGETEIIAAQAEIKRRCAADAPKAVGPAIRGMNDFVRQSNGVELLDVAELGVPDAYRALLKRNPQLDEAALARAAVDGMRAGVDPGASPDSGHFEMDHAVDRTHRAGIGIEAHMKDGTATVVRALPGGPAKNAGVQAGDRIVAIDGVSTQGWTLTRIMRAFRGERHSPVSITILRDATQKPVELRLRRAIVVARAVEWRLERDFGVITLHAFDDFTSSQVRKALQELQAPSGYILDLRSNAGGLLLQAIEVADLFLDGGVIVSEVSAQECPPSETSTHRARRGDEAGGAPLVVLVDSLTASGAELLAAALQDHGRAAVIGQRTFGNGEITTVSRISQRAGIRLKVGEMTSPSGRRLSEGILPTHVTPESAAGLDPALARAVNLLSKQ